MLKIIDLTTGYGPVEVLHDVNLDFKDSRIVTVLGANGAGKSTLIKTISGILKPWKGSILFDGKDISRMSTSQIAKMGIVHVPEGRHIFPNLTVRENLLLGGYFRSDKGNKETLDQVLKLFPALKERINQKGGNLSGGEQQMLAIARGLMAKPRLLLLDEPSLGLAPILVSEIFQTVKSLAQQEGVQVLLVEQNARKALDISDTGYVMVLGRIVLSGTSDELKENPEVRKLYLGGQNV
ncbi:MAG TPA: ABC transporter ATP-binding protein [Coprothermobacter proteolyticus]|jgi:branched-chain amino acid transport system ATP-binding protein|nr:branched-chain amino acid ABC transporter ATP-binding protein [Coprothermobacter sp.]HOA65048.1 ABC transporter ATP-binding protein [Coprothermobacter proteolyticus]HPZ45008.1 ABC transporter ATP-binding protein [Coprothermobacter proteolyticus]HQD07319.1 ABC transporter ATP-binding protein [Coprothermobacter proteolyticus]